MQMKRLSVPCAPLCLACTSSTCISVSSPKTRVLHNRHPHAWGNHVVCTWPREVEDLLGPSAHHPDLPPPPRYPRPAPFISTKFPSEALMKLQARVRYLPRMLRQRVAWVCRGEG
jgi:hypothetical protein